MQKIALVGFGAMGQMHARCYQHLRNARVVCLVQTKRKDIAQVQKDIGMDVPVYPTLAKALAKEEVDLVDICLPTDMHAKTTLAAIAASKNVFCEKPMAMNMDQAARMIEAARAKRVILSIGHCIRFWPEYQVLEEYVKTKKAGKLLSLTMQRRASRPLYSSENWLQNPKRSLGAVYDLHIHDSDFVVHLLGVPDAVSSIGTKDKSGWSHIHTFYSFDKKDICVTAEGGWNYPQSWGFSMAYQAVFEKGALEFAFGAEPSLRFTAEGKAPKAIVAKKAQLKSSGKMTGNIGDLGGYFNELKYFIDCLESGSKPTIATAVQAADSLHVVHAEIKSLETGKTVEIRK